MTIDEHNAAVQAAERDLADINAQIEAAKAEHEKTRPAEAVRSGVPLAEAGARHAAAEGMIGFLLDAAEAAGENVRRAYEARNAALTELKYREPFKAAVAKRLAAIKSHEAARLALETAEADFEMGNRAIDEALAAGFDRPPHLRENPLRPGWYIDHTTKVRLPSFASEAPLWSQYV